MQRSRPNVGRPVASGSASGCASALCDGAASGARPRPRRAACSRRTAPRDDDDHALAERIRLVVRRSRERRRQRVRGRVRHGGWVERVHVARVRVVVVRLPVFIVRFIVARAAARRARVFFASPRWSSTRPAAKRARPLRLPPCCCSTACAGRWRSQPRARERGENNPARHAAEPDVAEAAARRRERELGPGPGPGSKTGPARIQAPGHGARTETRGWDSWPARGSGGCGSVVRGREAG
jgi:hypothetical protein